METGIRGNLFSVAAVVSISAAGAVVVCALVVAQMYHARLEQPKRKDQALNVTGSARRHIRSDLAVWHMTVSGTGAEVKDAFGVLKTGVDRVGKFLDARKFSQTEISLSAIGTTPNHALDRHGNQLAEISGYTLNRTFTITADRVDAVASAAADVTELLQEGLTLVSSPPDYYYTKISDLKIEMIGEAAKDARARADQIVSYAGCSLTEVRNARMGVLQITQPESTEVSASGIYDTSTINKDVTAVVSFGFGLGPK